MRIVSRSPDAEVVVLGGGPRDPAEEAVSAGTGTAHHHRCATRAQGQGGELVEHVHGRGLGRAEAVDGGQLGVPAALAVDDQHGAGLAGLDGHGPDLHGVDEAEAGVAEVEVDAFGAEPEPVVDGAGDARLEVVLAHRRGDQQVDVGRGEIGQLQGRVDRPGPPPRRT